MYKADALKHFDNDQAQLAAELGITSGAISQWGPTIPKAKALELHQITGGKLEYKAKVYKK